MAKHTPKPDTPGRANPSSSRQQITPNQRTQTGSPQLDRAAAERDDKKAKYQDRPADEGKHGDADQEPNSGFPEKS